MGTASAARPGQSGAQMRRDSSAWRRDTAFTRAESRMMAETEQLVPIHPHFLPYWTRALRDLVGAEGIVPRRHRRVGRENAGGAHLADRFSEWGSTRHKLAHPFDQ